MSEWFIVVVLKTTRAKVHEGSNPPLSSNANVAQVVERLFEEQKVCGANPYVGTIPLSFKG